MESLFLRTCGDHQSVRFFSKVGWALAEDASVNPRLEDPTGKDHHRHPSDERGVNACRMPWEFVYLQAVDDMELAVQRNKWNHLEGGFTKNFRYLKWRLSSTLSAAILGVGKLPYISHTYSLYHGEDSSILGTTSMFGEGFWPPPQKKSGLVTTLRQSIT